MSNSEDDLQEIRRICKNAVKELSRAMTLADKLDDPRVVQRIHSAQSKLMFAKFAVHKLMRDDYITIVYDDDECSNNSICDGCPC